jgi:hypothetical protein
LCADGDAWNIRREIEHDYAGRNFPTSVFWGGQSTSTPTIQAAVLAGHTPTPFFGAPGGGQMENFPRFLENFGSSRTVTINGSFVSLWFAQYTNSQWRCCGYYNPPVRDWNYDDRFLDPANLPPHTPTVGQVLRMGFARRY